MGTGILTGEVYETRTAELYAADAGVEDAVWKIQEGETPVCPAAPNWSYSIADVNGKSVQVSIEYLDEGIFRITSIAATDDGGGTAAVDSSTTVESYLSASYMDFSSLLDYAIISNSTITIQPGNVVDGDVWLPDKGNPDDWNKGNITGDVKDSDDVVITWPTADQLRDYYLEDVAGAPDCGPSIDIKDKKTIGPCDRKGSLTVDNSGGPATLVVGGTVYIRGDLEFRQPGSSSYTIDLNGNTIFAEGSITFPAHHVNISGSGCIIAVGPINFQPGIASEGDDFVLVMSITDYVEFHPSGDFTGCVAGSEHVQLQPGCTINWISSEGKGLNFPTGPGDGDKLPPVTGVRIDSWEVK